MFHPKTGNAVSNVRLTFFIAALVLILPAVTVRGQGGVGSSRGLRDSAGGIHTIQGRVLLPSGRRAQQGILVRLSSNVAGTRSASTDSDGAFIFNGLSAGEYRLTVDGGPEFTPTDKSVVIYGSSTGGPGGLGTVGQTLIVDVTLTPKGAAPMEDKMFQGVPKEAVDAYRKGMQFAGAGDSKKAAESFKTAVTIDPKFAAALTELGTQYLKLNDPVKAAESLKQATDLAPTNSAAHLRYGIALLNTKKPTEAEAALRAALKLNQASPAGHMYLGIALLTLSRDEKTKEFHPAVYAEAQKELETAVATGKEEVAMAHRYLGGIYWGQKDHKRAADELETYLKLEPKAPDAERTREAIKDLRSKQ